MHVCHALHMQTEFLRLGDVKRVFIGGMQRYLHLLLNHARYTTKTRQEVISLNFNFTQSRVCSCLCRAVAHVRRRVHMRQ
jgi:hypothetical protein